MFNLELAIAEWRRQMLAAGVKNPNVLDELDSHLREDVQQQMCSGLSAEQAFEIAVRGIGQPAALRNEFAKTGGTIRRRIKRVVLMLTGGPNPQLALNMNTSNSSIEPGWATYLKAAAFLMPAGLLWLFSLLFLMPKLREICLAAGMNVFSFEHLDAVFQVPFGITAAIGQLMIFVADHGILIGGVVVFAFMLLERRSKRWPRYRRATLGVGLFLFNFAVLLSITMMVLSALVATTTLMHHVK